MNLQRILFLTVAADAVLSIGSFVVDCIDLSDGTFYYGAHEVIWPVETHVALLILFFGFLLTAWIGILRFWSPARYCYLGAWMMTLVQFATVRGYVAPGWVYALYSLVAITGGFLIALIFCSDLRGRFEPGAQPPRLTLDDIESPNSQG